ncbi:MAG TPA: hypothetical protein VHA10_20040 [Hypericibacter adhaerens]|jgi:hypothetical protein|uniref:Lipoprotein n=1 Tax=Hypericibacter adhaerens TaxID=2602016 RepID=A0A5J6N3L3_9PROT|nr:hypothetical protein [Hypericibacter adhaerens]QEX23964.1 hypothetical protein FRZ61_39050 [Hypericibacter adhaerens]HWA45523.1 hypothetical protein [Hypericibacter adhaerens]
MRIHDRRAALVAVIAMGVLGLSACGKSNNVEGNTYLANGGAMSIQFKSDGKAAVALGPMTGDCSYVQKDKTVSITCEGEQADFTLNDDGSLNGPPDGMIGRLEKKAN